MGTRQGAVWTVVDRERLELAALREDLSEAEWAAACVCEGRRVRDVATHLALAHTGPARALVEVVRPAAASTG